MGVGSGALQVVRPTGKGDFEVEESALEQILLDSRVADTKLMIVSVVGGSGKGKSFLLNVFMKYLQNYGKNDWMDVPNEPVNGFKWGYSNKGNTKGLLLWHEPFIVKMPPTNDEVCVLLMDSQGCPPTNLLTADYMKIFALTTKLSSVQICVTDNLRGLNLLCLEAYLQGCEGFNIQRFYFLIRNWQRQKSYNNGLEGGNRYMKDMVEASKGDPKDFQKTSKFITEMLKDRHCFILPDPGLHVRSRNFKGCLSDNDITADFKSNLKTFTELVLGPENVVVKEIDDEQVTGRQLFKYFKTYTEQVNGLEHSTHLYHYPGTAENVLAIADAKIVYRMEMNKVCGVSLEEKSYMSQKSLDVYHHLSSQKALQKLREIRHSKKLCGEDFTHEDNLRQELQKIYNGYKISNLEQNGARPYIYPGIFILSLSLKMSFMYGSNYGLTITNTIMYGSLSCSVAWVIFKFVGKKNKQVERMRGILELVPNGIIYGYEKLRKDPEIKKKE